MQEPHFLPQTFFTLLIVRTGTMQHNQNHVSKQWWTRSTLGDAVVAVDLTHGLNLGSPMQSLPFLARRNDEFYFDGNAVTDLFLRDCGYSVLLALPATR